MYRQPGSVTAVGNPGSIPAQPFIICKLIGNEFTN